MVTDCDKCHEANKYYGIILTVKLEIIEIKFAYPFGFPMLWNALVFPCSFPLYLKTNSSPTQVPITHCKKTTKKMSERAPFVFADKRASS